MEAKVHGTTLTEENEHAIFRVCEGINRSRYEFVLSCYYNFRRS